MSIELDPLNRLTFLTGGLVAGVVAASLVIGFVSVGVVTGTARIDPEYGGFAVLAVLGMASATTWNGLTTGSNTVDELPDSWLVRILVVLVSIVYYNVVILISAAIAYAAVQSGLVVVPVLLAVLFPVYDAISIRAGVPVSISGVFAISIAIVLIPYLLAEEIDWSEIHIETALFGLLSHETRPKQPSA